MEKGSQKEFEKEKAELKERVDVFAEKLKKKLNEINGN